MHLITNITNLFSFYQHTLYSDKRKITVDIIKLKIKLKNITIHEGHGIREILAPPSDILK